MIRRAVWALALVLLASPVAAQTPIDSIRAEAVRSRAFIRAAETQLSKVLDMIARMSGEPIGEPVDTAPVPVDTAVADTGRANEPSGMTPLLHRDFNASGEDGWTDRSASNADYGQGFSIAGGVGRITLPAGHPGSGSSSRTATSGKTFQRINAGRIYLSFRFQVSDNWFGHTGGQNKVFYLGHPIVVEFGHASGLGGTGRQAMYWTIALQGGEIVNLRHNTAGNLASPADDQAVLPRGQWVNVELLIDFDRGGIHFWQNGVKLMEFAGRRPLARSGGQYDYVSELRWHPIYGGQDGAALPAAQYQAMDRIYLSRG